MISDLNEFVSRFSQKLERAGGKKAKLVLVADNDLDGLFSATKMDLVLYEHSGIEVDTVFRNPVSWDVPLTEIKEFKPDLVLLLDIALTSGTNVRRIPAMVRSGAVFQIDHHVTPNTGLPLKQFCMLNPCTDGDLYLPTTYLVEQFLQRLFKEYKPSPSSMHGLMTLLGVFADAGITSFIKEPKTRQLGVYAVPELQTFYEEASQSFPKYFSESQLHDLPFLHISKVCKCLEVASFDDGFEEWYLQIINSFEDKENGLDALNDEIIKKYSSHFARLFATLHKILSSVDKSKPFLIYRNRTVQEPNSTLSRYLVEMIGKPVVVYSTGNIVTVSARAPVDSTVDFVPVFNKYGGGGHKRACGIKLDPEKLLEFISDLKKTVTTAH
ncbi:MAG: DHHA1 domain-containing protein [Promethearchaeota archaeon]